MWGFAGVKVPTFCKNGIELFGRRDRVVIDRRNDVDDIDSVDVRSLG